MWCYILGTSNTHLVPLMQIDCEVLDTRLIHIEYGSIPRHFRTHGNFTNATYKTSSQGEEENRKSKPYRPYFLRGNKVLRNDTRVYFNDHKNSIDNVD